MEGNRLELVMDIKVYKILRHEVWEISQHEHVLSQSFL